MKEQVELLCDSVETVNGFSYLGNRLNVTGRCKVAVFAATTRVG